jgi:hypothetical protein
VQCSGISKFFRFCSCDERRKKMSFSLILSFSRDHLKLSHKIYFIILSNHIWIASIKLTFSKRKNGLSIPRFKFLYSRWGKAKNKKE